MRMNDNSVYKIYHQYHLNTEKSDIQVFARPLSSINSVSSASLRHKQSNVTVYFVDHFVTPIPVLTRKVYNRESDLRREKVILDVVRRDLHRI